MGLSIKEKISIFKKETKDLLLNNEQQRIYNAFVYQTVKPINFRVTDRYGNIIHFTLYTNKRDDGVIHILERHYKEKRGEITAIEILDFCNIIRFGDLEANKRTMVYTYTAKGYTYKLILALKKTRNEKNILKSFYSNK